MQFWSLLGSIPYAQASELQKRLVDLRAQDQIPDTILFLEHVPVITQGRGLQYTGTPRPRHMPRPERLPPGIMFAESERGGDLTYHGPGQLVVYPILKIDDVAAYLRRLEQVIISTLAEYHIAGSVKPDATGVWVGDRKVASIGIAVRKWVTYHGAAINIVNELEPFRLISPCGFSPEVMTRLADLAPGRVDLSRWRAEWERKLVRNFCAETDAEVQWLSLNDAFALAGRVFECSESVTSSDPALI